MTIIGMDVSNWQGMIAWDLVNATDISFVYSLCSDGYFTGKAQGSPLSIKESYDRNQQLCTKPFGAYHFARPTTTNPILTAEYTASANEGNKLPAMLDIEASAIPSGYTAPALIDWCRAWCNHYEAMVGRKPVLYHGLNVFDGILGDAFPECLWCLPSYPSNSIDPNPLLIARPDAHFDLWQYTDKGTINGIRNVVDKIYTTSAVFDELLIGKANDVASPSFVGIAGQDAQYILIPGGKIALSSPEERDNYVRAGMMADNTVWLTDSAAVTAFENLPTVTVATGTVDPDTFGKAVAHRLISDLKATPEL